MHGDTIANGPDIEANAASVSVDGLFMTATDAHYRISGAIKAAGQPHRKRASIDDRD